MTVHRIGEHIFHICDASILGVGLYYRQGNDWETCHPAGFLSKKFSSAQLSYCMYEQETLAILEGLLQWACEHCTACQATGCQYVCQLHCYMCVINLSWPLGPNHIWLLLSLASPEHCPSRDWASHQHIWRSIGAMMVAACIACEVAPPEHNLWHTMVMWHVWLSWAACLYPASVSGDSLKQIHHLGACHLSVKLHDLEHMHQPNHLSLASHPPSPHSIISNTALVTCHWI